MPPMSELTVIVPTKGRPRNVELLLEAWADTSATAHLIFVMDKGDIVMEEWLANPPPDNPLVHWVTIPNEGGMVAAMNFAVQNLVTTRYVGFMGDDHRPRSKNWDHRVESELWHLGTGIVYGDDGIQHANLPTSWFMTMNIVEALGYMNPPTLRHMFGDNFILDLGRALHRILYLPDVVIEHMHPIAHKVEPDVRYAAVWPEMGPDRERYEAYKASGDYERDVEKVRALL